MQNLSKHLLISEFDKEQKKKRTKEQKNKISEKVLEHLLALWKVLLKI